jgi:hypothetical protein
MSACAGTGHQSSTPPGLGHTFESVGRTMNLNITKKEVQAIRRIIRHIHTSDQTIQKEVLRIDALLETLLNTKKEDK